MKTTATMPGRAGNPLPAARRARSDAPYLLSAPCLLGLLALLLFLAPAGALKGQSNNPALPAGWSDADIGSPGQAGWASYVNGLWTVAGGGSDIWNAADQFNFASTSYGSDGSITAQVTSLQNSDPVSGWSKAGLMFRNDSTAGSVNVSIVASAGNGVSFQWRSTAGGQCSATIVGGVTAPVWLKLVRSGQNFAGYYSSDGTNWLQVASQTVAMSGTVLAGLAVTAHNNSALNTATFTNVSPPMSAPSGISVQFVGSGGGATSLSAGQIAGVQPFANWNLDALASGGTDSALADNNGVATPATVQVVYYNSRWHSGDNTTTPDGILNSGGFWSGGGYTVNVTGVPYATYDVYVYMLNDNHPNRRYGLTLPGATIPTYWGGVIAGNTMGNPYVYTQAADTAEAASATAQTTANYVHWTGVSASSFTISVPTPDGNVAIMGIQIVGVVSVVPMGGVAYSDSADFTLNTLVPTPPMGGVAYADSTDFTLNTGVTLSPLGGVAYADSTDFTLRAYP